MSSQDETRLSANSKNAYISIKSDIKKNISDPAYNKNYLTAKPDRARSCSPSIRLYLESPTGSSGVEPKDPSTKNNTPVQAPNKPLEIPIEGSRTPTGTIPKVSSETSKSLILTGMHRYEGINKRNLSPHKGENSSKKQKTTDNILSNNRYALLSEDTQNEQPVHKSLKPPPIFLREPSTSDLVKTFINLVGKNNFHIVPLRKGGIQETKIVIYSEADYRKISGYLNDSKKNFYTYQLKSSKGLTVVIKGIESSVKPTEIKEALEELGFNSKNVINIFNKDRLPQPLFKVELEPNDRILKPNEVHPIYSLRYLLNRRITMEEPHKRNTPVQCSNCQEYGHTKNYCKLRAVCVACGELHPTTECNVIKNDLARKCGNCGGNHSANYRGCLVYKTLLKRLREKKMISRGEQAPVLNLNINSKTVDSEFPLLQNGPKLVESKSQLNIEQVPKTATGSYANVLKSKKLPNTTQNTGGLETLILTLTQNISSLSQNMSNFMASMQSNIQDLLRAQNQMIQILLAKK